MSGIIPTIKPRPDARHVTVTKRALEPTAVEVTAGALPTRKKTCLTCKQNVAPYTCPRCQAPYCSVACYKEHSEGCTEEFFKSLVLDEREFEMKEDGKKSVNELLIREKERREDDDDYSADEVEGDLREIDALLSVHDLLGYSGGQGSSANESGGDDNDDDDDNDNNPDMTVSDLNALLDKLPEKLRVQFNNDLKDPRKVGEMMGEEGVVWQPFWFGEGFGGGQSGAGGANMESLSEWIISFPKHFGGSGRGLRGSKKDVNLMPNFISILLAIVGALRLYNGNLLEIDAETAAKTIIQFTPVLSTNENFATLHNALESSSAIVENFHICVSDVKHMMQEGEKSRLRYAKQCFFIAIEVCFKRAVRAERAVEKTAKTKENTTHHKEQRNLLHRAQKKIEFYASYLLCEGGCKEERWRWQKDYELSKVAFCE